MLLLQLSSRKPPALGNPLVPCLALSVICDIIEVNREETASEAKLPSQLPESLVSHSSPYLTFRYSVKVLPELLLTFLRKPLFHLVL